MSRPNILAYSWQVLVAEMQLAAEPFPCGWCTVRPLGNELLKYVTIGQATAVLSCHTYDLVLTCCTGIHVGFCSFFFHQLSLSQ